MVEEGYCLGAAKVHPLSFHRNAHYLVALLGWLRRGWRRALWFWEPPEKKKKKKTLRGGLLDPCL